MTINKYDPRLKLHEELNALFVCGESILKELWVSLAPGKNESLTNQSWIITGPRGAGKSHLLTKLYKDIKADEKLSNLWIPLIFPEELYGVHSLFRLLVKVIDELFRQNDDMVLLSKKKVEFAKLKRADFSGTFKQRKSQQHDASKKLFKFLMQLRKEMGKKFILLLENLQMLFTEQLTNDELQFLRSVMQEHPEGFIIIGTALSVVNQIEVYGNPFYHFFKIRRIDQLSQEGMVQFISLAASYYDDTSLHGKIKENRPYIYTFRLLTGGNPRLILLLYELLRDTSCLSTELILEKIMDLTPYFKDRTLEASPQKRIILEALAFGPPAQTATEIADYLGEDAGSIMEQLKRLKTEGWINGIHLEGEGIRKKEVFYSLRDYFYRVWYKMRSGGIDEADVFCMAELVTVLYKKEEIEIRAASCDLGQDGKKLMYTRALELMKDETYVSSIERLHKVSEEQIETEVNDLFDKAAGYAENNDWDKLMVVGEKLTHYNDFEGDGFFALGLASLGQHKNEQAIRYYKKAVALNCDDVAVWNCLGISYGELNKQEMAIKCYEKVVMIQKDNYDAWYYMGQSYTVLKKHDIAIKCFKKALEIKENDDTSWFNMGYNFAELQEHEKAIECFENVVSLKKDNDTAWYTIGVMYSLLNKHEKAIENYRKAVVINEGNEIAWNNLGVSYNGLQKYEKAIECFQKAVSITKDYYDAWYNMGRSNNFLNKHEKAIECYKNAIAIKENGYEAWNNMATSYCRIKPATVENYQNAYNAYSNSIIHLPYFITILLANITAYTDIAAAIFTPSQSLQTLLAQETTTPDKLEALCQLLLLGKLTTVLNEADELLKTETITPQQVKKLLFFTEAYLLDLLETDPGSKTTKEILGFWGKVCSVYYKEDEIKRAFQEFFIHYIRIAGKEKLSLGVVENMITQLKEEGIIISDILLAIVRCIKNPNSREAKKWSGDPLFAEIVKQLSEQSGKHEDTVRI
ncbi:MAG: tetratricopeptide repeat protein [Spirochaetales bacterium]|nr:tetratricopeptide repeat protein [Spirochaetales bacterium]